MICDLHCHTKLSDGSLGIEDIIMQAKRTCEVVKVKAVEVALPPT